jgi:ankyrin repeat protein
LAPWGVQEVVVKSLRAQSDHHNATTASQASLELGVCHLLGFGVERDETKVLQYIDQAAAKGCFEARRIRQRLYQAFEKSLIPLGVQVRLDEQEERQIQRIVVAEVQNLDADPFRLFDDVVQDDFRAREQGDVLKLHEAAYVGHLARLETLLTNTLDYRDDQGRTALFLAVQGGHVDAIKVLLERGRSDPSLPNEDGHTALHMLIMMGTADVDEALALMLEAAPELDLNVFSSSTMDATEHWTELWGAPLHWAVLGGNKATTAALVRAGARVHDWPEDSCPVRLAASLHLSEILELLLAALPSGFSLDGCNPLFWLNASNPFRRLLLHGKDHVSQIGKTVSLLTKRWPILDDGEEQWNGNPLRKVLVVNFSATDRHIAAALIAAGADQDKYDGLTLLQAAIVGCHGSPVSSVCRMALDIIDIQPDLGRQSADYRSGWTALHWAAAEGIVPVARKLLEVDPSSINVRTQEDENRTPLHLAAEAGKSLPMIELLLERSADASLTTSSLKVTPLGSFVSNQRGELNLDILKALLHASANAGYLALSSDKWNVLHYAATRAALLDAESLPGHLLLRALIGIPEIQSLIESTTSQGWTPLHLASYLVDFTTIKLLVNHFHADVQARTPSLSASAFDIVLERARQYPSGLRGTDSRARWSRLAYRSALFLQKKLEALEGPYHLTPLHLAAYVGYHDEVLRIIYVDPHTVLETNYEGETPREMLLNTLPSGRPEEWATRFCDAAAGICTFLESTELKVEEEGGQS